MVSIVNVITAGHLRGSIVTVSTAAANDCNLLKDTETVNSWC